MTLAFRPPVSSQTATTVAIRSPAPPQGGGYEPVSVASIFGNI